MADAAVGCKGQAAARNISRPGQGEYDPRTAGHGREQVRTIVQCGTNMSLLDVTEKLEPVVEIPILGVNAVLFWYALRENGFTDPLVGGGRLLREF
jgi:maleate cis-trans isomerase